MHSIFLNCLCQNIFLIERETMRKSGLVQSLQSILENENVYFRASFFDQSSLYTTVNFLQFLAVLVTGYAICILLLYLTYLGINKWEMEPYTNYTLNADDYYENKIAEEQADELNDQLIEFSFKDFNLVFRFIQMQYNERVTSMLVTDLGDQMCW